MVCKKSLYCLKNGPCANYQVRKQIWEDNIRFRESLRNINRSDHYWSFQINSNENSDLDENSYKKKKGHARFKNCIDCASVTHEGLSLINDSSLKCICSRKKENTTHYVKPEHAVDGLIKDLNENSPQLCKIISPSDKNSLESKQLALQSNSFNKIKTTFLNNKRNCLSSAQLQPNLKVKFPSQPTLMQQKKNLNMKKFPSMDKLIKEKSYPFQAKQNCSEYINTEFKEDVQQELEGNELMPRNKRLCNYSDTKNSSLKKEIKLPPWLSGTPLSRTTRRMISNEKQIPFATFGCNNSNDLVGSKKTHNVFASKNEVFPNALSAKLQREEFILKSLKNERQFRNSALQDHSRNKINHSSLWNNECHAKGPSSKGSKCNLSLLHRTSRKIIAV